MKKLLYLVFCLMVVGVANSTAATYRFTASNSTDGVLGFMDFDSSTFDGSVSQFVTNAFMLNLDFTNPTNGFHITTIGPLDKGTYFDSSGVLPTVLAGFGSQGGTGASDEVTIVVGAGGFGDPSSLVLGNGTGNNLFTDVSWGAAAVPAVPEPETYAMLLVGLGLVGLKLRDKIKRAGALRRVQI